MSSWCNNAAIEHLGDADARGLLFILIRVIPRASASYPLFLELDEVDQIPAGIIELDRPDRPGILRQADKVDAPLL